MPAAKPSEVRRCPFCGAPPGRRALPFASHFGGSDFTYFACSSCRIRYIDPVPGPEQLTLLYAPDSYHAEFYEGEGPADYAAVADRLAAHLPGGARVLDYGCGGGHLLVALRNRGFAAQGAEFSAAGAANAERTSQCPVMDLSEPTWSDSGPWDCIHFGDVIEHLPDPLATLRDALAQLAPGGWISAVGPLEANASLVNGAIALYGAIRHGLRPSAVPEIPPYHLTFANAAAQRALFAGLESKLEEVVWQVEDDGWPYRANGFLRNAIALASLGLSRLPGLRGRWGNRFAALYRLVDTAPA